MKIDTQITELAAAAQPGESKIPQLQESTHRDVEK